MVKPPRAIARFGFVVELLWQESSTKNEPRDAVYTACPSSRGICVVLWDGSPLALYLRQSPPENLQACREATA
jgi:hypothetical protein